MGVKERAERRETERMPNFAFRGMETIFKIVDFFHPRIGMSGATPADSFLVK